MREIPDVQFTANNEASMITIIDKVKAKYNSIDIEKKAVLWTIVVIFSVISAFMLLLKFPVIITLSLVMTVVLSVTYALYLTILETLRKREKNK